MENEQNDQAVDVNALTLSLTNEFEQLHPVSSERCIYRVPKRLKELDEKAYTPQCVSIGPYHHDKDELKPMEKHKTLYLQRFLRLREVRLETFVSWVNDNKTRLQDCYQERINLSGEDFVRLMVVDAAFVIMVMLRKFAPDLNNEDDLLFNKPLMIRDIKNDMILLENQLPFFILVKFLALSDLGEDYSMVNISSHFLKDQFPSWVVNPSEDLIFSESKHLVDFLRIGQQPLGRNRYNASDIVNLPSVKELHQAGVQFKRCLSQRLMDISFRDGILEIPQLKLVTSTKIILRNILAFEQCHLSIGERYLNDYIFMIKLLVTNEEDLKILTKEEIIQDFLRGNEQVVHLLHNLGKQNFINPRTFYFTDVVNDLNKYSSKGWNTLQASLTQNYFYSPGAKISVFAAAFAILLTIIQTILSFLKVK